MKKSLLLVLLAGTLGITLSAQDSTRGGALYKQQCASCHGDNLQGRSGPPLTGGDFRSRWPAADLIDKIRNTMPQDNPGKLTTEQSADLAGYIQAAQPAANSAPAPVASAGSPPAFPPAGNLIQLMRGIMFPNSNIIFTVQTHNPGEKKKVGDASTSDGGFNWSQWGNDLYSGWEIVDYAALALADSAPLMLTPGRRCENGKPVPVDDPDWIRFTKEMADVGRATYRASQTRDQEKVSDISGDVADSCLHCHQVFRDRIQRGRVPGVDPSGKELRCTKAQTVPRGR
ncbi:MAG TPA: cytochrome c [Bryobacteraceae bacterium]|jgi:cytochrome c553|nr:cytochrome c [Bryobacteraceae bacterium]